MSGPLEEVKITYARSDGAWKAFDATVRETILTRQLKHICEVGGGANPALPGEFLVANGLDYTILDISREELDKAPSGYKKVVADLCDDAPLEGAGTFELVFSKMLAEHISDPETFHRNVWTLLANGGTALHFFPTLYSLPFLANRMMPEWLSSAILHLVDSRDRKMEGKFPAFYKWCRGPTRRQIARFEALKYRVLEYRGFFGHGYYNRIPALRRAMDRVANGLVRHPLPDLTSYACIVLQKAA